ncbi:MAG: glutamine-hydrolyzing carbamoyl-phosphate synthase small subunit, partial [Pseudomonadota bacterium]
MSVSAVLALADGTVFNGISIGAKGNTTGEVVFNTSMTGYQEILSDPSYSRQIVTLTYPHIGNTGTTPEDQESSMVAPAGLVIRDLPLLTSNWRSSLSLREYLERGRVVAIADIDTRKLTRALREKGAQAGCIMTGDNIDPNAAVHAARRFPGLAGMDLAKVVTTRERYQWNDGVIWREPGRPALRPQQRLHVVAYDFGIKRNILRLLAEAGCRITVVPAQTPAAEVFALQPDGIFLSNGPGDPEPCTYAIEAIREFLQTDIPVFGICLGHQLLGLAAGARTMKMKFGHHGANHPVQDLDSRRVMITSQNHGFAVDPATLPVNVRPTHVSLFDGSLQGIEIEG